MVKWIGPKHEKGGCAYARFMAALMFHVTLLLRRSS